MKGRILFGLIACFLILSALFAPISVFADTDTPTPTPTDTLTPTPTDTPTSTPTPSSGCWDPAPGGSVELTTASASGAHNITLTWTDATDPVSYYLLSYGLAAGQYIYGNPNIGGQGTTSYIVGGLATGKTYYFVVRAGNGCMPGTFSNELSAVAGEIPTPTPLAEPDPALQETPTPISEIPTDTPTSAPTPEVLAAESSPVTDESNSLASHIMLGATAVGVICAVVGGVFYLRMKKKQQS